MKNEKKLLDELLPESEDFRILLYEKFGDLILKYSIKEYDMFRTDEEITPEMQERFDWIWKNMRRI